MSDCRRKSEAVEPGDACYGAAMSAELLQDRRHLLLMLQSVVDKRFGFLNRLPWSLARWHDRAHVERCRAEYTATMDSAKHRVARAVFQGLASDIDVYVAGGTPSLALEAAFVSVSLLPLSEQVVESPHAEMKRESLRAAASSRSWHSSTNRLVQNLEYVRALPAAGDGVVTMAHLAMEWRRVTRVLQLSTKHCLRRRRLPWASFPSLVYRAAHRESGTVEKLRSPLTHTHTQGTREPSHPKLRQVASLLFLRQGARQPPSIACLLHQAAARLYVSWALGHVLPQSFANGGCLEAEHPRWLAWHRGTHRA
jgi:hypothetical protein